MGDIYSFGSLEFESKLLMEIFSKDEELRELIEDENEHYVFTGFNGNDGVPYPSYKNDMIKNLDEFIDYLILQSHQGAIVGNFETFKDLMWNKEMPEKRSILNQINQQREAIKASLKFVNLSFSIDGIYPDGDNLTSMVNSYGLEIDPRYEEIEYVNSGNATLTYEYKNGLSKWSINGEFDSDEIDETIIIKYEKEFKEKY